MQIDMASSSLYIVAFHSLQHIAFLCYERLHSVAYLLSGNPLPTTQLRLDRNISAKFLLLWSCSLCLVYFRLVYYEVHLIASFIHRVLKKILFECMLHFYDCIVMIRYGSVLIYVNILFTTCCCNWYIWKNKALIDIYKKNTKIESSMYEVIYTFCRNK